MSTATSTPETLRSKHHFEILDGLRGIAAISVVTFHFMEWVFADYAQSFIGHGYLAVDFFFCLSGFVIAYAYDDRVGKMGVMQFFKARLIRLHPLVVLGSVLGLLTFLFDPFKTFPANYTTGRVIEIFVTSALLIPFPVMPDRFFNNFGVNAPAWSLFWEYIANIFYALVLVRMGRKYIIGLLFLAAALLCYVGITAGNLAGGWSGGTFWDGGARVLYSFVAGLLVYRLNLVIKNKLGFIGMTILLVAAFLSPYNAKWNWLSEPLIVLLYFPLLIALGAGAELTAGFKKICIFFGMISYPLYMTHYAVIWMFGNYFTVYKPSTAQTVIIVVVSELLLIGVAYLAMMLYDIPLRKYLSNKSNRMSRS